MSNKNYKTLLEQYKITVPEGTSEEVMKLLVDKHEEALAALEEKAKVEETALQEIQQLEEKLAAEKASPKANGYGSFAVGKQKYTLTTGKFLIHPEGSDQPRIVTAEEFLQDTTLQKQSVEEKWGIVEPVN